MGNEEPDNKFTDNSSFFQNVEFLRLTYSAKKNIKPIIVIFILATIACFLIIRYSTRRYKASTVMQISTVNRANEVLDNHNSNQGFYDNQDLSKEMELLKSKLLFTKTLSKLPIEVSYYNKGHFLSYELYKNAPFQIDFRLIDSTYLDKTFIIHFNSKDSVTISMDNQQHNFKHSFPINKIDLPGIFLKIKIKDLRTIEERQKDIHSSSGAYSFIINSVNNLANKYADHIKINILNPSAKTVKISVTDPNAKKASEIAKALANEFIQYDVKKRSESSEKIIEFINRQLDLAYNRLKSSEQDMKDYKKSHHLSDVKNFSSIYLKNINNLNDQLVNLSLQINVLKEVEKKIKASAKSQNIIKLISIVTGTKYAGNISNLMRSLYDLYNKREELKFSSTADNFSLKNINHQIEIQKEILVQSLEQEISELELAQNNITEKNNQIVNKLSGLPDKQIEYARLQRTSSINENFFSLLQEKRIAFSISKAGFVPQHLILEKAQIPESPFYPNIMIVILSSLSAAVALSILFILISFIFQNKISSTIELESYLGSIIPVIGSVPFQKSKSKNPELINEKNGKSYLAETFRSIRTNLQFFSQKNESKTLCVTSTISGEGKTFVALNMASIMAMAGKKVIVLDIDLRNPKVHKQFEVQNKIGITHILIGKAQVEECIQKSKINNLDFITAGINPPNPSELLLSEKLNQLIETLKSKYDLIVIDTPPVGLVTDGINLFKSADYPLYVFRADYSKRQFVKEVKKLYYNHNIKKLAVIFNGVKMNFTSYSNYKYGTDYYESYYESNKSSIKKKKDRN